MSRDIPGILLAATGGVPGLLLGMGAEKATGIDAGVTDTVRKGADIVGMEDKNSPLNIEPLPATPTISDATDKAKVEAARKRRITLLSGGKTDYTSGQALGGSSSAPKSLLGA
jgi:hypothetical protein